jgi:hypothetical protein
MKGEKTKEQRTKATTKYSMFKCNTVSVSPSASGVVVSSKQEEKKNRGG